MVEIISKIKTYLESPSEKFLVYFIVFGLFGFVLYFVADSLAFFVEHLFNGNFDTIKGFIKDLGIAFIISAILAIVINRLTEVILLKKIEEAVEGLKAAPKVLGGAFELCIEDIFARRNPQTRTRAENAIHDIIKKQIDRKEGEIRLLVVAAPDYLKSGSIIGDLFSNNLAEKDVNCKLKMLLLDQGSKWALFRGTLEKSHPTILDIEESINYLDHLKIDPDLNNKIEYRLYDAPPIAFLIITDEALILEPYPIIEVDRRRAPIGGWTPMMVVRKDHNNEIYRRWSDHFEYLWTICDPRNVQHSYF
jgi:uncharacterized membrane protein YvlD (DUF360 family)